MEQRQIVLVKTAGAFSKDRTCRSSSASASGYEFF